MEKQQGKGYYRFIFKCIVCGIETNGARGQKFCSDKCRAEYMGKRSSWKGLATGTVGAIQELRVSVDLLSKGYEVFRALSPSCSCDLLALKDKKLVKIEVRTAYENKIGKLTYPKERIKAEHLALALPNRIIYEPEL